MYLSTLCARGVLGVREIPTIARFVTGASARGVQASSVISGRIFCVSSRSNEDITEKTRVRSIDRKAAIFLPRNCSKDSVFITVNADTVELIWRKSPKKRDQSSRIAVEGKEEQARWREQTVDIRKLPAYYSKLAKLRLTGLVVTTAMAGYALAPGQFELMTFLLATLGTGMCSASANSINQWLEIPFDCQMSRTQDRVLVRRLISPQHALAFGCVIGVAGVATLFTFVNGLTAFLGALNIALYTLIYTPLKRVSIANTWMGSVVGALPPMMGWTACTGDLGIGALLLAGVLYSWQFAHFNALSWNLRADYSRAGYRMMSVTDPALCRRVALRHSVALIGLCTLLPVCDVTTWWLAVDSLPLNGWISWLAYKFYNESDNKSARKLFRFSLIHLPLLMALILWHKKPKQESDSLERKLTDSSEVFS